MNSIFLSNSGDLLSFNNLSEFNEIIADLDTSVPARNKGRKSFHRERTSVILYLKALVHFSQIEFPFTITKTESPDFVICIVNKYKIGIEHRDIASEKWQQYLGESAKNPNDKPVYLDQFKLSGPPTNEINQGWVEREIIDEWNTLALEAIVNKVELLNKGHYQELDSYELLLYSNTHLPISSTDLDKAIPELSNTYNKKYESIKYPKVFDSVSIIMGDEIKLKVLKFSNAA